MQRTQPCRELSEWSRRRHLNTPVARLRVTERSPKPLAELLLAACCVVAALSNPTGDTKSKAAAPAKKSADQLSDGITRLLARPELKGATVGIHVVNLKDGKTLFAHEADRMFIPASNAKLFTTAAALSTLGPDFEFRTIVGTTARDLVVVGGGDPTIGGRFTDSDPTVYFRRWAKVLKEQRVTHIAGDLILDDGKFDRQLVHPNWPKSDLGHWYAAPVAALVFNDSCIDVRVAPGSSSSQTAEVTLIPNTRFFEINNRTRMVRTAKEHAPRVARAPGSKVIQCDGAVYDRAQPITSWVPVDDPVQYFGAVLREILAEEGIRIDGTARSGPGVGRQSDFQPRLVHRFRLLPVLEVTNKESQNLFAEQIFKTLGAQRGEGNWANGRAAVADALGKLKLDPKSYVLDDGCGLSRSNRASPRGFTALLVAMQRGSHGDAFRSTLSVAGIDGTLKKRLTEQPYAGHIWAKTGSISGVRSISGYVETRSGERLAFSMLVNNVKSSVRSAQDDFCKLLVNGHDSRTVVRSERSSSK